MSGPNDQGTGRVARVTAEIQRMLAGEALPAIKESADAQMSDLGDPGQIPSSVAKAFGEARRATNEAYDDASARGAAALKQQATQSGMNYNPGAVSEAATTLDKNMQASRSQTVRALAFEEAQYGMNQTNALLGNLTGQAGNLFSGALGFGQNAQNAFGVVNQYQQQRQQQSAQIGSVAGTILGGVVGSLVPGLGTVVGAGLGGAAGGAVGGYFGGGG